LPVPGGELGRFREEDTAKNPFGSGFTRLGDRERVVMKL